MKKYIIIDGDDKARICEAERIKDCVVEYAKYTGCYDELFEKALIGLSTKIDFIDMYNRLNDESIKAIVEVAHLVGHKDKLRKIEVD